MSKMTIVGRRERKKLKLQNQIVDTAMALFEEQGFAQTTMERIAEETDIAKATLYRYYPGKETILAAFWRQKSLAASGHFSHYIEKNADINSCMEAYLKGVLIEAMKNYELYKAYFRYQMQTFNNPKGDHGLHSDFDHLIMEMLSLGVKRGEIREDMALDVLAAQFEMATFILILNWLKAPNDFKLNESVNSTTELFLNGASSNFQLTF